MAPGLMVCGTASNAGKTTLVAGLCRLLARRGLRIAPFKAQNMAPNSAVTASGHEIGRAQFAQAQAAGVNATVAMNPVLLTPTGDLDAQVVVARDIDLGGVFASLAGTVALLPPSQRRLVRRFVINKFRGDPALLGDGLDELERRCGVPTLGVVPMLGDLHLDAEDSVALTAMPPPRADAQLDVAVIAFPRLSNFTDLDPLAGESDVAVRFVRSVRKLGRPDLIVLGGSKATAEDLSWMRSRGIAEAVLAAVADSGAFVLGICGGYQMLGGRIHDDIESRRGTVQGLGLLGIETVFEEDKVLAQRRDEACGAAVWGYQIHHGRVRPDHDGISEPWLWLNREPEGWRTGRVMGTTLHGLFESDSFRHAFLAQAATQRGCSCEPAPGSFAGRREARFDRIADAIEAHVDIGALFEIMGVDT
ncbi:cobyric acid synthase [Candidatus Poriferisodalis sp.]|uniref:cobyric acid synthase n=1 Tax=Candidatus Poriferisodalis sp. TaxID=3101277 RepID=UPI003D132681